MANILFDSIGAEAEATSFPRPSLFLPRLNMPNDLVIVRFSEIAEGMNRT